MVRLKETNPKTAENLINTFQFLHGAIKSMIWIMTSESMRNISIPSWCD